MGKSNFLTKYNGHQFEDWGIFCSEDFKTFADEFKKYLKTKLPKGCKIVKHKCGHYDISGFVKKEESCVYYSYTWNRFTPVNIYDSSVLSNGILVRNAKDENDFTGGYNQFTCMAELPDKIAAML